MAWLPLWPQGASEADIALYSLALATLILALAVFLSKEQPSHDLGIIPGPRGLPLIGSLLDVGHPQAHQTIAKWAQQWPAMFKFKMLHYNNVVITDPSIIAPLLNRGPDEAPKAIKLIYSPIDQVYSPKRIPSFFSTPDPAKWAAVRKGCAPGFSPENVRRAFPVVRDTVSAVCDVLASQASQPEAASKGLDISDAALRVALDSFGLAFLGHDFKARGYGECEVLEMLPLLLAEFSRRALDPLRATKHALMPWLRDARAFRRNIQAAHALWAQLTQELRQTDVAAAETRGDTSLRTCLAKLEDPATGLPMSQEELAPHVAAFLVAGFETTAHSVAWALYEIARLSEVQAKLAAELGAAGLLWAAGKPGRELEYADLAALPYLDQVWREALRLHPVASVGPIRMADRDIVLRTGHRIPKGTILWLSIISLHLSQYNFADADRFWPERWSEEGRAGKEKERGPAAGAGAAPEQGGQRWQRGTPTPSGNSNALGRSFMPFSYGPKDCMGQALANVEGKAMLAMLCSRFQFAVAPCMGSPEEVRAAEVNRLTLQAGKGVWLLLTPRAE